MFQTGGITLISFFITFVVGAVAIYTLFLTWYFLQGTDWQQVITLFTKVKPNNQFGI